MTSEHDSALEKAAVFLESTAADYRQMAGQCNKNWQRLATGALGRGALMNEEKGLLQQAQLLEGQAQHIRGMKQ